MQLAVTYLPWYNMIGLLLTIVQCEWLVTYYSVMLLAVYL